MFSRQCILKLYITLFVMIDNTVIVAVILNKYNITIIFTFSSLCNRLILQVLLIMKMLKE